MAISQPGNRRAIVRVPYNILMEFLIPIHTFTRLTDFFKYYAREFLYNTGVASIREGLLKKETKGWQNDVCFMTDFFRRRNTHLLCSLILQGSRTPGNEIVSALR